MADLVPPIAVSEIVVGIFSTLLIHPEGCGIATTVRNGDHLQDKIPDSGELHKKNLSELAQRIFSLDPIEASIAMAAINSSLNINGQSSKK
mgnify:CR=1 FL=1